MAKCIQCGYCCITAPCPYGVSEENEPRCKFLQAEGERLICSKYEEILKDPGSVFSPAFGAGCCSPLFNSMREKLR